MVSIMNKKRIVLGFLVGMFVWLFGAFLSGENFYPRRPDLAFHYAESILMGFVGALIGTILPEEKHKDL